MKELFGKISQSDIRNVLSVVIVIGCFIILYLLLIKEIPANNKDVVLTSVGFVLGGALGGVIGYHFSSNRNQVNNNQNKQL